MDTIIDNSLLVIWQDNKTRLRWVIGQLSKGRKFYIAGIKYYSGKDCSNILSLKLETPLSYELEPTNKFDENAIIILNENSKLGYVPTYFSKEVTNAIQKERKVQITIIEINCNLQVGKNCHECVKVEMIIK
jgi:hypothetical protein